MLPECSLVQIQCIRSVKDRGPYLSKVIFVYTSTVSKQSPKWIVMFFDDLVFSCPSSSVSTIFLSIFLSDHFFFVGQSSQFCRGGVYKVVFNKESSIIASVWSDGTVKVWDVSRRHRGDMPAPDTIPFIPDLNSAGSFQNTPSGHA